MFKYEMWDKVSNIDNLTTEKIFDLNKNFIKNDVFIVRYGETLTEIHDVETIRCNNRFPLNFTSLEVAQAYIDILNNPKENDLANKISILEAENQALKESQDIQDRTIVESDMRMIDLECALGDLILASNPDIKINSTEVFNMKMFGRSATYFNQLKQMIERENYDSREEMERILNKYKSGRSPRITQEEYDQLFDMLYPPVYEILTTIPEI